MPVQPGHQEKQTVLSAAAAYLATLIILDSSKSSSTLTMALTFQPKVGGVVMCDFVGFIEPEMVKKRPVVVIARNRGNKKLVTVVPLSTTEPETMQPHHYQLPKNPVPAEKAKKCWAKCDMVATVSIDRMDRLKDGWNRVVPEVTAADLNAIRVCVVNALQLQNTILPMQTATVAIAAAANAAVSAIAAPAPATPVISAESGSNDVA
jgi:uncharacterized protein YifN (PemK superfamily)